MGFLGNLSEFGGRWLRRLRVDAEHASIDAPHICRLEELEARQLMSVTPPTSTTATSQYTPDDLHVGVVWWDPACGCFGDDQPSDIQISFQGGATGTTLNQVVINASKSGGVAAGDVLFDSRGGGGPGTSGGATVVAETGSFTVTGITENANSTQLAINLSGFTSGDVLELHVNDDLVTAVSPSGQVTTSEIIDGADFQGSTFDASFSAPNYEDTQLSASFYNRYDANFAAADLASGTTLDLPPQRWDVGEDETTWTAGAVAINQQVPIPGCISGTVYLDSNENIEQDGDEPGVAGAKLELWQWNGTAYVDTGLSTNTDAQGNYTFTNLAPGNYRVVETTPGGYIAEASTPGLDNGATDGVSTSSTMLSQIVVLGGDVVAQNDFALVQPVTVSGYVYHDSNDDGQREANEQGIGGVQIELVATSTLNGIPVASQTTTTAANGSYSFTALPPGTYQIIELTNPAGYLDGLARAGTAGGTAINPGDKIVGIVLASGKNSLENDFGKLLPSVISGYVRLDANGEGTNDPSDAGIPNATVQLRNSAGAVIATTTTDSSGAYQFAGLAPGSYSVYQVIPSGYYYEDEFAGSLGGSAAVANLISGVTLADGSTAKQYNFYDLPPGSVSGYVRVDTNLDKTNNPNDPALAGATVALQDSAGTVVATTTTSAGGFYQFKNVAPGVYTVVQTVPTDYYFEDEFAGLLGGVVTVASAISAIAVTADANATQYDFFDVLPAAISGYVRVDLNLDHTNSASDPPLAGATVTLRNAAGAVVATTTTGVNGYYQFNDVAPGTFSVTQTLLTNYYFEDEFAGSVGGDTSVADVIGAIKVAAGVNATQNNFYDTLPATISGYVRYDNTDSHANDSSLPPLAGVTVELLNSSGKVLQTTTTDTTGYYEFDCVPTGSYQVEQLVPTGYYFEDEFAGSLGGDISQPSVISAINVFVGQNAKQNNFYDVLPASLSGVVYNDVDGKGTTSEPPLAGATVELVNSVGTILATTTSNSSGDYSFTGLKVGTYSVEIVVPSGDFQDKSQPGSIGGTVVSPIDIGSISVTGGASGVNYDFWVMKPASLSGVVYNDVDGKGTTSEPPLAGVTVELVNSMGTIVATTTSSASGDYSFTGLKVGTYSVEIVVPSGDFQDKSQAGSIGGTVVSPIDIGSISVTGGANGVHYDFWVMKPASLSGVVYNDVDGKGTTSEPPLAGVTVELVNSMGTIVATTTSSASGDYSFTGLKVGTYSVEIVVPSGDFQDKSEPGSIGGTVVSPIDIGSISVTGGANGVHYDFWVMKPASLSGVVYNDVDGKGTTSEPPLAGVTVELVNSMGTIVATTTSSASGDYSFTGLKVGTYSVEIVVPSGDFQDKSQAGSIGGTVVSPIDIGSISVTGGASGMNYDFWVMKPASLSGVVYNDVDGKGTTSEPPLTGVTVELVNSVGTIIATTTSNSSGDYSFTGLKVGTYSVEIVVPSGDFQDKSQAGSIGGTVVSPIDIGSISVTGGASGMNYDFWVMKPASLSGVVYNDVDGKGTTSEPPLTGVTVELVNSVGTIIATTTSNSSGDYSFTGLKVGTYSVEIVVPSGDFQDKSQAGSIGGTVVSPIDIGSISVIGGANGVHYDFWVMKPASLSGVVYNDVDGKGTTSEPPLTGVTVELVNSVGTIIATTTSNSSGDYSFTGFKVGTYSVEIVVPSGDFQDKSQAGSIGGTVVSPIDIGSISVTGGASGMNYDFWVMKPASLSGVVYNDVDGKGTTSEPPLTGVTVELVNSVGTILATTTSNSSGDYSFTGLKVGTYSVEIVVPSGDFQDKSQAGSIGGTVVSPIDIGSISVTGGANGVHYDFWVMKPSTISGSVHNDVDGDCDQSNQDPPAAGVAIELLDNGNVVATTVTNSDGAYSFTGLPVGVYSVVEVVPAGWFAHCSHVGSAGGVSNTSTNIGQIDLPPDTGGDNYDFCIVQQVSLSGVVYDDTAANHQADTSDPVMAGVTVDLLDATGATIATTTTGSNGAYLFTGLEPGAYGVADVAPSGLVYDLAAAGSLGGMVAGAGIINAVSLASGQNGVQYNFWLDTSPVATPQLSPLVFPTPTPGPALPPVVLLSSVNLLNYPTIAPPPQNIPVSYFPASQVNFSWHLSVIDDGQPRGESDEEQQVAMLIAMSPEQLAEIAGELDAGEATLAGPDRELRLTEARRLAFGLPNAVAVTGDFDGDGDYELGAYVDGNWYLDVNGNGVFDQGDLYAKLGRRGDRPVTGDWDGDGKTDIGIYGPQWNGDRRAMRFEPGLPDSQNTSQLPIKKNHPPAADQATDGKRELKTHGKGKMRADVIDHVFGYGKPQDTPVAGDWNGDGTSTIAIFNKGTWRFDSDGDGRLTDTDKSAQFGQAGDLPVVGDWNGDGLWDVGVFRDGAWYLDTNGDKILDERDEVVRMGSGGDQPISGDWNGDGRHEPGVYRAREAKPEAH